MLLLVYPGTMTWGEARRQHAGPIGAHRGALERRVRARRVVPERARCYSGCRIVAPLLLPVVRPPTHPTDPDMLSGLNVCLVVPCHNEEDGIRDVLPRLPKGIDDVVVVDNNCTDRTAEVATSLGARVVAENRPGYGAAYKAGFRAASGDVVVTLDGDGTYPPEHIPALVEALATRRLDFI